MTSQSGIYTVLLDIEVLTITGWEKTMFYNLNIGDHFRIAGPPASVDGKIYKVKSEVTQNEHCTPGIAVEEV
jgi:hypothetical protein